MILCLETATSVCSVALIENNRTIAIKESLDGQNHAKKITIFINDVIKQAGVSYSDLDAIAISMGPGSYTGLRIGVSTAKGLCYAAEKPLIAVDTLKAMAYGQREIMRDQLYQDELLCPMIDARRMEVYVAFFDRNINKISPTTAIIVDKNSFYNLKHNYHLYLFGDGADKLESLFEDDEYITVIKGFHCSAAFMAQSATEALREKQFVDVAYFEPFYLKDFIPGKPKVKGLK